VKEERTLEPSYVHALFVSMSIRAQQDI
jgi:hypothetical protein